MLCNKSRFIVGVMALLTLSGLSLSCDETLEETLAPQYTLKIIDASGNIYSDILTLVGPGIKVQDKTVRIVAEAAQGQLPVYVVRNDVLLQPTANGNYELIPGNNQMGVFIGAYPKSAQTIDIKWINIYYRSPVPSVVTVEPAVLNGEIDVSYTFTARTENPPTIASYEWKKNGELLGKGGGSQLTTKFPAAGTYTISVTIYDVFFEEMVGTGEAVANIK